MQKQKGFALVSAIFLVVVLSMLGAFMLNISSMQHIASAQDVDGSRAYRAARMGMEWASATICNGAGCATPRTTCPAASTTLTEKPDGFTVTVSCVVNSFNEAGVSGDIVRNMFTIDSVATNAGAVGGISKIERRFRAELEFAS